MAKPRKIEHGRRKALLPRKVFKTPIADFFLGFCVACFAAACAYLPFHIYMNSDEFGPPEMALTGGAPDVANADTPDELEDRKNALLAQQSDIDQTVTGAVEREDDGDGASKSDKNKTQDEPNEEAETIFALPDREPATSGRMVLVFAAGGRGLIRDGNDLLPVFVGKKLPDGSIVKEFSRSSGSWKILTSDNQIIAFEGE